ncbi:MAG: MATE family efflux transporter, partial [Tissierellia bacterium]|nr:MATE family efflux transporter [Tissierellia bacterium]
MSREVNLLTGDIKGSLVKMSLPLMGISFIQMTYNMVDTIWLGRLSTEAVAAVGICSFFIWFANAVVLIS